MSGWGSWFGGGGQKKRDAPKNAILQLRSTMEMLNKREKHLQNQIDDQDTLARKYINTNKAQAKAALRRKKQYEHTLEQTSAQIMTVENQISSIETANINKETFDAMRSANSAFKNIHGNLNIDKVDQTMEELREQKAIGDEISTTLTQPAMGEAMDDDELEAELGELEQKNLEDKMIGAGHVPVGDKVDRTALPEAPTATTRRQQEEEFDEEEELKKLQAEMAM